MNVFTHCFRGIAQAFQHAGVAIRRAFSCCVTRNTTEEMQTGGSQPPQVPIEQLTQNPATDPNPATNENMPSIAAADFTPQEDDLCFTRFGRGDGDSFVVRNLVTYKITAEDINLPTDVEVAEIEVAEEIPFNSEAVVAALSQIQQAINIAPYNKDTSFTDANNGISLFISLATHYPAIKTFITDKIKNIEKATAEEKIKLLTECQNYVYTSTNIAIHFNSNSEIQGNDPLTFLHSVKILFEICTSNLSELLADPKNIFEKFNCQSPCYEARYSHFFGMNNKILTSNIDRKQTTEQNLTTLLELYFSQFDSGDPSQFKVWVENENGVLGATTSDGEINKQAIDDFIKADILGLFY